MKISPTSVEAFDNTTPFGCERKWWFKYVAKLPDPGTSNQRLGTDLHAAVERFLLKGAPGDMAPDVARLFAGIKPEVLRVREEGFVDLEKAIDFELAPDVRVVGRVDVVRPQGPLDWKTTSDLKYAPTPFKLAQSTQMLLYSRWQATALAMPTQVTHVYVQTKGHNVAQRIDANMTPSRLTEGVSRIINLVDRMKAAEKSKVEELPRSPEKCFRCPYVNVCPADERNVMDAVDLLKARLAKAANPAPAAPAAPTPAAPTPKPVQSILPSDAPKFERKLPIFEHEALERARPVVDQAVNVDAPHKTPAEVTPVVAVAAPEAAEAPKRRGRPPGSKNKPKELDAGAGEVLGSAPPPPIVFRTVTVSMTGKLNMGHYQSLDVHVSQTADYTGDPSEAFMQVCDVVKKQLDAALEGVAGRTVAEDVPQQVLMSTKR